MHSCKCDNTNVHMFCCAYHLFLYAKSIRICIFYHIYEALHVHIIANTVNCDSFWARFQVRVVYMITVNHIFPPRKYTAGANVNCLSVLKWAMQQRVSCFITKHSQCLQSDHIPQDTKTCVLYATTTNNKKTHTR